MAIIVYLEFRYQRIYLSKQIIIKISFLVSKMGFYSYIRTCKHYELTFYCENNINIYSARTLDDLEISF